jgi:hypothetical protein
MGIGIDRHTADVHFYKAWLKGLEIILFSGKGIIDTQHTFLLIVSLPAIINYRSMH